MQNTIMKHLGKQMREKAPVSSDLPLQIQKALSRLANAETRRAVPMANAIGEN
jgi:hypothetical protein